MNRKKKNKLDSIQTQNSVARKPRALLSLMRSHSPLRLLGLKRIKKMLSLSLVVKETMN